MVTEVEIENRFLKIDGIRSHVQIAGTGPDFVLVHGLGGPLMWQKVIEPLAQNFRVIVIDLPGFGDSDPPEKSLSAIEHADFLSRCLVELGCERVNLCGISYGGQVAALCAIRHPAGMKNLVLLCSTGLINPPMFLQSNFVWRITRGVLRNTVLRSEYFLCRLGARSFYNRMARPDDLCSKFFTQLSRIGGRETWLDTFRNSFSGENELRSCIAHLQISTLIIWGENDITVPIKYAKEFRRHIPHSKLIKYEKCAHSIPLETPERFCKDVVEFLKA